MNREKLGKLTVLYDRNRTSAKGFVMYAIKFLLGEGRWRQIMSMCQCNHPPGIAARDCNLHFRRTFRGRVIDLFDFSICLSAFRRTGESPRPIFTIIVMVLGGILGLIGHVLGDVTLFRKGTKKILAILAILGSMLVILLLMFSILSLFIFTA